MSTKTLMLECVMFREMLESLSVFAFCSAGGKVVSLKFLGMLAGG